MEIRSSGDLALAGPGRVRGYAAVFGSAAHLGAFDEIVRPGAFADSLASGQAIRALYHHQGDALLGSTRSGTLQLREDDHGLRFELALPDTTHGRDLAVLIQRGDVAGCSFGFTVPDGGDRWEQRSGTFLRELLRVDLREITLTSDPAYTDTTVALRSLDEQHFYAAIRDPIIIGRAWLETCR
ncbi:HK97 family phage prohead protease [Castellaniella defragrans]|uniref:HK97 family phage prohead protease n=1 Tax=Castellaniella defragrans TaxID=75697 RepID=UPI0005B92D6A|nr:HK97 family phage prohead protease [Castellaniella defragrans]